MGSLKIKTNLKNKRTSVRKDEGKEEGENSIGMRGWYLLERITLCKGSTAAGWEREAHDGQGNHSSFVVPPLLPRLHLTSFWKKKTFKFYVFHEFLSPGLKLTPLGYAPPEFRENWDGDVEAVSQRGWAPVCVAEQGLQGHEVHFKVRYQAAAVGRSCCTQGGNAHFPSHVLAFSVCQGVAEKSTRRGQQPYLDVSPKGVKIEEGAQLAAVLIAAPLHLAHHHDVAAQQPHFCPHVDTVDDLANVEVCCFPWGNKIQFQSYSANAAGLQHFPWWGWLIMKGVLESAKSCWLTPQKAEGWSTGVTPCPAEMFSTEEVGFFWSEVASFRQGVKPTACQTKHISYLEKGRWSFERFLLRFAISSVWTFSAKKIDDAATEKPQNYHSTFYSEMLAAAQTPAQTLQHC